MSTRSLLFSTLPKDIVLNILARVPRRYHPIISCVSKELRSLISSSELHKTRSLLVKDCFYVRFKDFASTFEQFHWFTLTEDRRLVSTMFPSPPKPCFAAVTVGHDIYFVSRCSLGMWILDSRSGTLLEGPSLPVANYNIVDVRLVNDKIYIFGANWEKIYQVHVFDLKTQTWQIAPNPTSCMELGLVYPSVVTQSLGRKIYARGPEESIIVYDTRDGKCDTIIPAEGFNTSKGFCVVDNVLYVYYDHVGLMWYDQGRRWHGARGAFAPCHCDF